MGRTVQSQDSAGPVARRVVFANVASYSRPEKITYFIEDDYELEYRLQTEEHEKTN